MGVRGLGTVRWAAGLVVACGFALAMVPNAQAAACGWNRVCPYQGFESLGGSNPASLDGPLAVALTPDGNAVVADDGKQNIREFDPSGHLLRTIGSAGGLSYLHAVAVDQSSGEIYAEDAACVHGFKPDGTADGSQYCAQRVGPDWTSPRLESLVGGPNDTVYAYEDDFDSGTGQMVRKVDVLAADLHVVTSWPVAATVSETIAVDAQGDVYLPDYFSALEYDANGDQLATVHLSVDPSEVVVAGTTLYARSGSGADSLITPYTLSGAAAGAAIPVPEQISGALPYAMTPDFAAGPDQLVATTADHQIQRFGLDGTLRDTWGGLATDDLSPVAAFEDASGDVDVVDIASGHARVVRYDARRDPPTQLVDLEPYLGASAFGSPGGPAATTDAQGDIVIQALGKVVTVDPSGNVIRTATIKCPGGCEQIASRPDGDLYVTGWRQIFTFSPDGALLSSWPITTHSIATDAGGNVYVDGPLNTIRKYSPDGTLLTSWDAGGGFEPVGATSLATDSAGNVYATAIDGVHVYQPSGVMVAVWPFTLAQAASLTAAQDPGKISVGPDGAVLVSGTSIPGQPGYQVTPGQPGGQVFRYSDLLTPFPPVPPADESPWAQLMRLQFQAVTQSGAIGLDAKVGCRAPSGPAPRGALCTGTLSVSAKTAPAAGAPRSARPLARRRFSVAVGRSTVVKLNWNAIARRLFSHHAKVNAILTATYRTGPTSTTVTRRVVLRRHRQSARRRRRQGR